MELHNTNLPEALPYQELALPGIDREKADKLPDKVKGKMISSEMTPLMQVSIEARNGDVIQKTVDINGEKTRQYFQLYPETKFQGNQRRS